MFGMDRTGRVIYVNTFSVTIAPSVRIGYMCLPERLVELWENRLGFSSCPVPVFEQYTLAEFISGGYFERHINRMKKHYRRIRELVLQVFTLFEGTTISEERAGLHFLADICGNADEVMSFCDSCGIQITPLSEYFIRKADSDDRYVVNYRSADEDSLSRYIKEKGR